MFEYSIFSFRQGPSVQILEAAVVSLFTSLVSFSTPLAFGCTPCPKHLSDCPRRRAIIVLCYAVVLLCCCCAFVFAVLCRGVVWCEGRLFILSVFCVVLRSSCSPQHPAGNFLGFGCDRCARRNAPENIEQNIPRPFPLQPHRGASGTHAASCQVLSVTEK